MSSDDIRFVIDKFFKDPELKESKALFNVIFNEFASLNEVFKHNKYLAILFDEPEGLVYRLQSKEVSEDAKKDGLDFLTKLIAQSPALLATSLPKVKCLAESLLFLSISSAKVRIASLNCLSICFKHAVGSSVDGNQLNVGQLCERLRLEVGQRQTSEGVTQGLYRALGSICKYYPEEFQPVAVKISANVVKSLVQKIKSDHTKVQFAVIASLFEFLSNYFCHFSLEEPDLKQVYHLAVKVIAGKNYQRYEAPKQALLLFANHCSVFSAFLAANYEVLFEQFFRWSTHHNRDLMHVGMLAFDAFVKSVSTAAFSAASAESATPAQKKLFLFFLQQFRQILDSDGYSWKTVSVAVRGFGYFAEAAKKLLAPPDMRQVYADVVQRAEDLFTAESDSSDERLSNLPSFVESLSNLALHLDELTGVFLSLLARLSVTVCHMYPRVSERMDRVGLRAVAHALHRLRSRRPGLAKAFAAQVVYQSLVRTCSHEHPVYQSDTEAGSSPGSASDSAADPVQGDASNSLRKISYKDYLRLWLCLFSLEKEKKLCDYVGMSAAEARSISGGIFDAFLSSVLAIIERLDLSACRLSDLEPPVTAASEASSSSASTDEDTAAPMTDTLQGMVASTPKDIVIFVNLVDFVEELLQHHRLGPIAKWFYPLCQALIEKSAENPLISGFYKLLATFVTRARDAGYFNDQPVPVAMEIADTDTMESDNQDSQTDNDEEGQSVVAMENRTQCCAMLGSFAASLSARCGQLRGDLLAASLRFLLSLPASLLAVDRPDDALAAVRRGLRLGRFWPPLLEAALAALDRWTAAASSAGLSDRVAPVLAGLLAVLLSDGGSGAGLTDAESEAQRGGADRRSLARQSVARALRSIEARRARAKNYAAGGGAELGLAEMQKRVLLFLGSAQSSFKYQLAEIASDKAATADLAAWSPGGRLLYFDLPFADSKPRLYLDPLLSRCVALATESSSRQSKVAAAECLHSIVLLMTGRCAFASTSGNDREQLLTLWRRLLPALLPLAADEDPVVKQLFQPLLMQLVHWFSRSREFEGPYTALLLDSLFDRLTASSGDASVRDLAAQSLREFLTWSVRQQMPSSGADSTASFYSRNVKSIVKRVCLLALHPASSKRLGAALAFNAVYAQFREEDSLVNAFAFELLHCFMRSIQLADADDASLGTVEQCDLALDHLERIMVERAAALKVESQGRRTPLGSKWTSATLEVAVRWLVGQCGQPESACRAAAMRLLVNDGSPTDRRRRVRGGLARCLLTSSPEKRQQTAASPRQFFQALLKQFKANYFYDRWERFQPHQNQQQHPLGPLRALLACLECHLWSVGRGLLDPQQLLGCGSGSRLCQKLSDFFNETDPSLDPGRLALSASVSASSAYSNSISEIRASAVTIRCQLIVRTAALLQLLAGKQRDCLKELLQGKECSNGLWTTLARATLRPQLLGFDAQDPSLMAKLLDCLSTAWHAVARNLAPVGSSYRSSIVSAIAAELEPAGQSVTVQRLLPQSGLASDPPSVAGAVRLARGIRALRDCGLLADSTADEKRQILDRCCQLAESAQTTQQHPVLPQLIDAALTYALNDSALLQPLVTLLTEHSAGLDLLNSYKSCLTAYFSANCQSLLTILAASPLLKAATAPATAAATIARLPALAAILESLAASVKRTALSKQGCADGAPKQLASQILAQWTLVQQLWDYGNDDCRFSVLGILTNLLAVDAELVKSNDQVFVLFVGVLNSRVNFDLIVNGLALLGYMCRNPSTERAERLSSQLKLLCSETVLMRCSNQLGINSHAYCQYVRAFRALLLAQETSEHPLLLDILSILVCKERQHALEAEFQQCLNRLLLRIPVQRCREFVTWPWRLFRGDAGGGGFTGFHREQLVSRVLAPLLTQCHSSVLLDFVATDDCLEFCLTCLLNAQQSLAGFNESETEEIFLLARGCCRVLSCFYMACGLTELALPRLCDAFKRFYSRQPAAQKDPERSLSNWVSVQCYDLVTQSFPRCRESVRQMQCEAYNLLVHCIKAASDKERSYLPPFTENAAKRKFIFDNIVPTDVDYQLPLQVEQSASRKQYLVSVRPAASSASDSSASEAGPTDDLSWLNPSSSSTSALQFAASQFLADSSLSSDVSQFDRLVTADLSNTSDSASLATAGLSLSTSSSFAINQRRSRKNRFHNQTLTATRRNLIVLESDCVNDHPCMATMVALLRHMKAIKLIPELPEGVKPTQMPKWMQNMLQKVSNSSTDSHPNVRIFLMKLLINCQEIFQPYAHFWLRPMCQFALSDRNGGQGFHTLLVDIVYFFVAWSGTAIPETTSVIGTWSSAYSTS
ncbi:hypothetical protein BOX15_Mlig023894g2 [Macrostomum lignano]|uniref:DNA-dependent protein kinase catalytic subunit CC3 domain-containing protein n=2 Tax=Macrostomum lignano TaxID=282301 RepID=A0A267DWU7_9PLAT|nr:hypothetical protein BOX15_Mlig023894g2 [Macrostomum lignano]